ncbi:hypothetical protein ACCO45_004808 [Purpureocillium lilacinum]|uniref:Uncharacterized protein n=1 Tax=Purpureocillium lilacinum TaxID=33203 RepID=A0ACC4DTV5_PURLI
MQRSRDEAPVPVAWAHLINLIRRWQLQGAASGDPGAQTAGYVPINQFAGQRAPAPAVLRIEWLTSMMPTSWSMSLQCSQLGLSGKPASRWPGHDESTEPGTSRPADGWCLGRPSCFGAPFSGREAALREDGRTPTPVRRLPRLVAPTSGLAAGWPRDLKRGDSPSGTPQVPLAAGALRPPPNRLPTALVSQRVTQRLHLLLTVSLHTHLGRTLAQLPQRLRRQTPVAALPPLSSCSLPVPPATRCAQHRTTTNLTFFAWPGKAKQRPQPCALRSSLHSVQFEAAAHPYCSRTCGQNLRPMDRSHVATSD